MSDASYTVPNSSDFGAVFAVLLLVYLVFAVLMVIAWVKIISKAGYSGWWVLIGLVPLVNAVMFVVFAFSDWPALRAARGQGAGYGPPIP